MVLEISTILTAEFKLPEEIYMDSSDKDLRRRGYLQGIFIDR